MLVTTVGWFIAGICVAVLATSWFILSFRVLSEKQKSLVAIGEQVQMHRRLYMQERGNDHEAIAQNILENKLLVYRKVEKDYNSLLRKPIYRFPAYIMGFRPAGKENVI